MGMSRRGVAKTSEGVLAEEQTAKKRKLERTMGLMIFISLLEVQDRCLRARVNLTLQAELAT